MKAYRGSRAGDRCLVEVGALDELSRFTPEGELPHVVAHSPSGYEWGYAGSGPADLALSLLAYHLGEVAQFRTWWGRGFGITAAPEPRSWQLHQRFKRAIVAYLENEWLLTEADVDRWIARSSAEVRS